MSKSRKNPNRVKQLTDYKNKHKSKKMSNTQPQSPFGMPEIRQSPIWKSDEMLEISGAEWESIFNFIESSSSAYMAANAVMSRNIINGKVKLKFEKLNKESFMYDEMTPEEEAPYQEEVQKAIKAAIETTKKDTTQKLVVTADDIPEVGDLPEPPSQDGLPVLDGLVDANGKPLNDSDKPNLIVV